jgi:hypothetical protein
VTDGQLVVLLLLITVAVAAIAAGINTSALWGGFLDFILLWYLWFVGLSLIGCLITGVLYVLGVVG